MKKMVYSAVFYHANSKVCPPCFERRQELWLYVCRLETGCYCRMENECTGKTIALTQLSDINRSRILTQDNKFNIPSLVRLIKMSNFALSTSDKELETTILKNVLT